MAIKNLIGRGIGFLPGSVKFIVTHGLSIGEVAAVSPNRHVPKVVHNPNRTIQKVTR